MPTAIFRGGGGCVRGERNTTDVGPGRPVVGEVRRMEVTMTGAVEWRLEAWRGRGTIDQVGSGCSVALGRGEGVGG